MQQAQATMHSSSGTLKLGFRIYKIFHVNTVEQTFDCDFRLFANWVDESLIGKAENEVKWSEVWQPLFDLANTVAVEEVDSGIRLLDKEPGHIHWHRRYRATFTSSLDLHKFPFDRQLLEIEIRIPRERDRQRISSVQPDPDRVFGGKEGAINPFHIDEWHIHPPQHEIKYIKEKPHFFIRLPVSRAWRYYVTNMYVILFLLTSMGFNIPLLDVEDLASRANLTLSLILTAVAFRFILAESLPKTGYLTSLDKYVLFCFLFMFAVGLQNVVVHQISKDDSVEAADDVDRAWMIVLGVYWIAGNVIACLIAMGLFSRGEKHDNSRQFGPILEWSL